MTKDLQKTRSDFIEKIGMIAQNDGLPRIAGRLLGLLVWDGDAVSFGVLAVQLQVSRGSISTATRILEERRLIKRIAKPGQRQDYFQLAENAYAKMLENVAVGLNRAQEEIDATLRDIPDAEAQIKSRVAAYSAFYRKMADGISTMVDDMK
jgi:DNA-binding transcriptional regulator GbsR (MarR family)